MWVMGVVDEVEVGVFDYLNVVLCGVVGYVVVLVGLILVDVGID